MYKLYVGKLFLPIEGEIHETELYYKDKKLKKGIGYIKGDMIYIYHGKLKKFHNQVLQPGIYLTEENDYYFVEPNDIEKQNYHVDSLIILDVDQIYKEINKNKNNFLTEKEIEIINENSEIFKTTVRESDDVLKKGIKELINRKNVNLRIYKDKFKNEHSFNNMKSALNKSAKMSIGYFNDWMEGLGASYKLIITDNGTDNISPLKGDIVISSEDGIIE